MIEDDTGLQDGFKAICKAFGSCNELPVLEFLEGKNFQREFSVQDIIPSSNPDSPLPEILENVDGHLFGKEVEQFVVFDLMDDENDLKTKKIQDQGNYHIYSFFYLVFYLHLSDFYELF